MYAIQAAEQALRGVSRDVYQFYRKKLRLFRPQPKKNPLILQQWKKGDPESYTMYWLIKANSTQEAISILESEGWENESVRNDKPYDCTGMLCHGRMEAIKIGPNRVRVTQHFWLDI